MASLQFVHAVLAGSLLVHVPAIPSPLILTLQPADDDLPNVDDDDSSADDSPSDEPSSDPSDDGGDGGDASDGGDGGDVGDDGPDVSDGDDIGSGGNFRLRPDVEIVDDTTEMEPEQKAAPRPNHPVRFAEDPKADAERERNAHRRAAASENAGFGGGYVDRTTEQTPPKDGEQNVLIGAILLPLGTLQLGGGVLTAVMGMQPRCGETLNLSDSACNAMVGSGAASATLGGLMAITGVVFLAIGLGQRGKHRRWKRERGQASRPRFGPSASGFELRF